MESELGAAGDLWQASLGSSDDEERGDREGSRQLARTGVAWLEGRGRGGAGGRSGAAAGRREPGPPLSARVPTAPLPVRRPCARRLKPNTLRLAPERGSSQPDLRAVPTDRRQPSPGHIVAVMRSQGGDSAVYFAAGASAAGSGRTVREADRSARGGTAGEQGRNAPSIRTSGIAAYIQYFWIRLFSGTGSTGMPVVASTGGGAPRMSLGGGGGDE